MIMIDLELISDSDHLLDILISMENVLDGLDVYSFANWLTGEVVDGPVVRRYWTTFSLRYPYNKMPDPRAALRLLKHGVEVEYNREKRQDGKGGETAKQSDWLITISIPRRLLDQDQENDLKIYADEVNPDDVTTAKDSGLDNESQYKSDEQNPDEPSPEDMPPAAPGAPPEDPNAKPPPR